MSDLVRKGIALAALLVALALPRRPGAAADPDRLVRRVVLGVSAYGCLTAVVLLAHWIRALN